LAVYRKIIDNNLSVRKIEEIVRSITEASTGKSKKKGEEPTGHQQLQEQLNRYFQVKVSFVRNPNGKGKIVLAFNNDAELEQILGKWTKLNKVRI
jgi:ParB family chromosome partitioning protein